MKKKFSISLLVLLVFGCQVNSINKLPESTDIHVPLASSSPLTDNSKNSNPVVSVNPTAQVTSSETYPTSTPTPPPDSNPGFYPTPTPLPTPYPQGYNGLYNISTNNYSKKWYTILQQTLTFNNDGFGFITLSKYDENLKEHNKFILNTFNKDGKAEIQDLELYDEVNLNNNYIIADFANNKSGDVVIASTKLGTSTKPIQLKYFEKSINKYSIEIAMENSSRLSNLSIDINENQETVIGYIYATNTKFYFVVNKYDKNGKTILNDKTEFKSNLGRNFSHVKIDKNGYIFAIWDDLESLSVKVYQPNEKLINYRDNFIKNVTGKTSADYILSNYNFILDNEGNLNIVWISYDPDIKTNSAYIQKFSSDLTEITLKKRIEFTPKDFYSFQNTLSIIKDEHDNLFIYPDSIFNNLIFLDKNLNLLPAGQKLIDSVKFPQTRENKILSFSSSGNMILAYKDLDEIYYKRFNKNGDIIFNP